MFSMKSMLSVGGRSSSSPEFREAVDSQLEELLHLLLSGAAYSLQQSWQVLPLPPDSDKLPMLCVCIYMRLCDVRLGFKMFRCEHES